MNNDSLGQVNFELNKNNRLTFQDNKINIDHILDR